MAVEITTVQIMTVARLEQLFTTRRGRDEGII